MKTKSDQRYFYVLYVQDGEAADCIETIRFLCNPTEKLAAHITVRGPYYGEKTKPKRDKLREFNRKLSGSFISIIGTGNFFGPNQNTVFFRCITDDMIRRVSKKSDYATYYPHLTLYDGSSEEFAKRLYGRVNHYKYSLIFS